MVAMERVLSPQGLANRHQSPLHQEREIASEARDETVCESSRVATASAFGGFPMANEFAPRQAARVSAASHPLSAEMSALLGSGDSGLIHC